MSTPQTQFATLIIPEEKNQTTDFKGIVTKYLYHWPLFVLGLIISIGAVLVYLQIAKPTYEIRASLIIKDEKKTPEQQSALSEIDVLSSSKLLENEIEILKSKQLISQVINELQLGILYQKKEGLKTSDLYKTSPVKLTILKAGGASNKGEISIVIKDEKTFLLKEKGDKVTEFSYNTILKNKFGSWKLEPTERLSDFKDASIKISILDPDLLALQYQKLIDISLSNKLATTVVLSLNDELPNRGEDILNQLMLAYSLAGKQEKEREARATLAFLDQRLTALSSELTTSEKGIEGFKSSRGLTDISSESRISLESMQANDTKLNEVNVQLSVIDGIENYVNSSQNSGNAPATMGLTDPALSSLIEKLSQLQLQRDKLLATTPETNPDFDPINRQITTTKAAIKENVRSIKSSLRNTRAKLQSFSAGLESSIKNIPTQERQLISFKRDQAIKENLYTYLLQKREEVSLSYANILSNDLVVDQAYAGPVKGPKKPLFLAVALLLGLCVPTGIIYGRNTLNNSIVDVQEIKDTLDIPVIGEISFDKSQHLISVSTDSTNAVSEQLRALRTNLYYLYGEKSGGRVTLITSSIPGEGKSFISSNLGLSLAHTDRKTIILEIDLRKPKVSETFNLDKEYPGVSDYLNNKATLSDLIRESGLDSKLHVISSGAIVNNPSELLENEKLKSLISQLRESYDDIIIDSPPVHLVADAMILSRSTDITLYVMKQGLTGKPELNFLKELHRKKQLSNINIVFNGVQRGKYGYGYDYNTSYYNHNKRGSIFSDFWSRF